LSVYEQKWLKVAVVYSPQAGTVWGVVIAYHRALGGLAFYHTTATMLLADKASEGRITRPNADSYYFV
jgi:hypothetical protein